MKLVCAARFCTYTDDFTHTEVVDLVARIE